MKIAILGTSGSGKSTLAQKLGAAYNAPVLHLDAVHFLPGWVERPQEEMQALVQQFMDTHDSWVIDGHYSNVCYDRRLEEADQIIVLDGGVVAEKGTHAELMQKNGKYARLVKLQTESAQWKL